MDLYDCAKWLNTEHAADVVEAYLVWLREPQEAEDCEVLKLFTATYVEWINQLDKRALLHPMAGCARLRQRNGWCASDGRGGGVCGHGLTAHDRRKLELRNPKTISSTESKQLV